jgi:LmbE family N-acetylglucosaminyl deacetylase
MGVVNRIALVWALSALSAVSRSDELPLFRPILPTDSVLVVAPHPDDESLCCGGLIHEARLVGARVAVVWITYGDAFRWSAMLAERKLRPRTGTYREFAAKRAAEARAASTILGLEPGSMFFLGYPDRGLLPMLLDHYYPDTPWRSRFTGADSVVYDTAVNPGAAYDGEDLERDFQRVLDLVKPTLVLAPSPQDTHPDHRGAGILAWRALGARDELDKVRFWIVHGGEGWPKPRSHRPELEQTIAPRGLGMRWERLPLDADARDTKLRAIRAHRSQFAVMGRVMESHVRADELFSRTPIPPRSTCALPEPCEFEVQPVSEEAGF